MSYTLLIVSSAAFAAVIPLASPTRIDRVRRFFERLMPRRVSAPPAPRTESGWTVISCDDAASFTKWLGEDAAGLPFKPGESPSLGSHLLVEMFDCDADALKHETGVGQAMREAAELSRATIVAESFHEFKPYGVSGAVIIQESHYTIHTWPEHGYAAVDLFYCGGTVHVHRAVESLQQRFRPGRMKFLVVRRGVQSEVDR